MLQIINNKLKYITPKQQYVLWDKEPTLVPDQQLDQLAVQYRYSEWNKESARYDNFVKLESLPFDDNAIVAINKEIEDWQVVGTTKYGRRTISKKYKLQRVISASEFYGS